MVSPPQATAPNPDYAIAACLNCNSLFLRTPTNSVCLLCGRPPAYLLSFHFAGGAEIPAGEEGAPASAPPAVPILIGVTCPHCHGDVRLSITDTEISVVQPAPSGGGESAAADTHPMV